MQLVSADCPSWIDDESYSMPSSGFTMSNATITDINGREHNIAEYTGFGSETITLPNNNVPSNSINTSQFTNAYSVTIVPLDASNCSYSASQSTAASVGVTVRDTYTPTSVTCDDIGLSSSSICSDSSTCILSVYAN